MEKTNVIKSEIDLILNLYMEEKMTVEEIERVTPFDFNTIDLIIKVQTKVTKSELH